MLRTQLCPLPPLPPPPPPPPNPITVWHRDGADGCSELPPYSRALLMICLMMSNVPTRVLSLLLSNFGRRKVSTRSGKEQAAGRQREQWGMRCTASQWTLPMVLCPMGVRKPRSIGVGATPWFYDLKGHFPPNQSIALRPVRTFPKQPLHGSP